MPILIHLGHSMLLTNDQLQREVVQGLPLTSNPADDRHGKRCSAACSMTPNTRNGFAESGSGEHVPPMLSGIDPVGEHQLWNQDKQQEDKHDKHSCVLKAC